MAAPGPEADIQPNRSHAVRSSGLSSAYGSLEMEMHLLLEITVCGDGGPFAALRRHAEGVIPLTALKARSKVVKSRKPHANAMSVIVHALIRSSPSMMEPLSSLVLTIHCATVAPFFWKIRCSIRIEIPSCRASVAGWKSGSCALRAMILQAVSNTPARSDVDVETRIGSSQSIAKISSVKLSYDRGNLCGNMTTMWSKGGSSPNGMMSVLPGIDTSLGRTWAIPFRHSILGTPSG